MYRRCSIAAKSWLNYPQRSVDNIEKEQRNEIVTRTHRLAQSLYTLIESEASKTGNAISNEMNSLILDGLRFREAKVIIYLPEQQAPFLARIAQ